MKEHNGSHEHYMYRMSAKKSLEGGQLCGLWWMSKFQVYLWGYIFPTASINTTFYYLYDKYRVTMFTLSFLLGLVNTILMLCSLFWNKSGVLGLKNTLATSVLLDIIGNCEKFMTTQYCVKLPPEVGGMLIVLVLNIFLLWNGCAAVMINK